MNNQRKLRAVVFDWAGTIIDFGCCAPVAAFVEAFKRHGITLSNHDVRQFMGRAKRDHIQSMLQLPHVESAWKNRTGRTATDSDIDLIYAGFIDALGITLANYSTVLPGVLSTVNALRQQGCKIGSNTGYTNQMMNEVVPHAKSQGYSPDTVMTADDGSRPSPNMIFAMAKQFGISDYAEMLKVDDTPVGIEEGRNAGTWAIGIARTGNEVGLSEPELLALPAAEQAKLIDIATKRLFDAGAHAVINSMDELLPWVNKINAHLANGGKVGAL